MWGRRLYKGRFFGIHAFGVPWEADGKEIMCDVSPSASQADLSKKPTLVNANPTPTLEGSTATVFAPVVTTKLY